MQFPFCFCFKRNRASYDISLRKMSDANSNSVKPTVISPPRPSSSVLPMKPNYDNISNILDDGRRNMNNEYPTPTTSTECNGYVNMTSRPLSQPLCEDHSELYATVDKTRQAKNAIRIKADIHRPKSITIASPQVVAWRNSRLSQRSLLPEHPSLSLPFYTNIPMNRRTSNYDDILDHRRSCYDHVKPRPDSSVNNERESTENKDLYAELGDGNASDTRYSNRQSQLYSRPLSEIEIEDNSSERYATISEVNNTEEQSTANNISSKY